MKETGIIMSGDLIPSMLDGRKTQAMFPMKPQPERWLADHLDSGFRQMVHFGEGLWGAACTQGDVSACRGEDTIRCPYGKPGDRLYVRETWQAYDPGVGPVVLGARMRCYAHPAVEGESEIEYRADYPERTITWRPSIHMPKWAARIWLEITGVRVERAQDISEEDAIAEGVQYVVDKFARCDDGTMDSCEQMALSLDPRRTFSLLWDTLNAKRGYSWESNPFVWVIEFKKPIVTETGHDHCG